jgi:hypothetical protein
LWIAAQHRAEQLCWKNKGSPPQAAGYFRREPIGGSRVASGSPGLAS